MKLGMSSWNTRRARLPAFLIAVGLTHPVAAADLDPILLGSWPSRYATARAVAVRGDQAFLATSDYGVLILDLTERSNPLGLGHYQSRGNVGGLAVSGEHLYIADETDGLLVFDISRPARPRQVGRAPIAYADDLMVNADYAYVRKPHSICRTANRDVRPGIRRSPRFRTAGRTSAAGRHGLHKR